MGPRPINLRVAVLPVVLIGFDDLAHHPVAHHVDAFKGDHANGFDLAEDLEGFAQTAEAGVLEIDLARIASDDGARVVAQAREEHEHLGLRGVLGLVENDEAFAEGAAAHESQGGNLNLAALHQFFDLVDFQHVVEGVIEGAQVGKNFVVEVAGEEAERLTRFHGGPSEHDALDIPSLQGVDGGGHRKVGFAGAGGADPEDDVVAADGLKIGELSAGARQNRGLARAAAKADGSEAVERSHARPGGGGIAFFRLQGEVKIVGIDIGPPAAGFFKLGKHLLARDQPAFLAFQLHPGVARRHFEAERRAQALEQTFVVGDETLQKMRRFVIQGERWHGAKKRRRNRARRRLSGSRRPRPRESSRLLSP